MTRLLIGQLDQVMLRMCLDGSLQAAYKQLFVGGAGKRPLFDKAENCKIGKFITNDDNLQKHAIKYVAGRRAFCAYE